MKAKLNYTYEARSYKEPIEIEETCSISVNLEDDPININDIAKLYADIGNYTLINQIMSLIVFYKAYGYEKTIKHAEFISNGMKDFDKDMSGIEIYIDEDTLNIEYHNMYLYPFDCDGVDKTARLVNKELIIC